MFSTNSVAHATIAVLGTASLVKGCLDYKKNKDRSYAEIGFGILLLGGAGISFSYGSWFWGEKKICQDSSKNCLSILKKRFPAMDLENDVSCAKEGNQGCSIYFSEQGYEKWKDKITYDNIFDQILRRINISTGIFTSTSVYLRSINDYMP